MHESPTNGIINT